MASKKNKKPMKKGCKVLVSILGVILALIIFVVAIPVAVCKTLPGEVPSKDEITNPYITDDGALVSAHRSGGEMAPENTMAAFKNCIESEDFNVDIFEFDLHITADNKLILLHDGTLDRTTNSVEYFGKEEVKPSEKTYEELRQLNFGENFENADGEFPYKGLKGDDIPDDLRAVLLEDVLDYLESNGEFDYIIEIKDSGDLGKTACDELYRIIKEKGLLERVVFGTFNMDITKYAQETYPDMLRSASIPEAIIFYLLCSYGIDVDADFFNYQALQIPMNYAPFIYLDTQRVINYAHAHNLAVQYWTINDPEDVEFLNSIGADCIMSDDPSMAYDIINK